MKNTFLLAACAAAIAGCAQMTSAVPASEAPEIQVPVAGVPAECAAFSGGWTGKWAGSTSTNWRMWITRVGTDCAVTYAWVMTGMPAEYKTARIENGVMTLPCDGGTAKCAFRRSG